MVFIFYVPLFFVVALGCCFLCAFPMQIIVALAVCLLPTTIFQPKSIIHLCTYMGVRVYIFGCVHEKVKKVGVCLRGLFPNSEARNGCVRARARSVSGRLTMQHFRRFRSAAGVARDDDWQCRHETKGEENERENFH